MLNCQINKSSIQSIRVTSQKHLTNLTIHKLLKGSLLIWSICGPSHGFHQMTFTIKSITYDLLLAAAHGPPSRYLRYSSSLCSCVCVCLCVRMRNTLHDTQIHTQASWRLGNYCHWKQEEIVSHPLCISGGMERMAIWELPLWHWDCPTVSHTNAVIDRCNDQGRSWLICNNKLPGYFCML